MSRLSKALVILGALLIWYSLIGFLIAPPLIRHYAEKSLQENFSEESAIATVRINPFTGSFKIEGLELADKAGAWSVAWDLAEVDLGSATFYKWYPVLDAVRIDGADLFFEKRPVEGAAEGVTVSEGEGDWRTAVNALNMAEIPEAQIDLFEISDARLKFLDLTAATVYEKNIDPINLTLRDLTTVSDVDSVMRFVAESDRGAVLSWEGNFRSQPIRSAGTLSVSGFAVHDLSPYFSQFITFDLQRALFGLRFDYALDLGQMEDLLKISNGEVSLGEIRCQVSDASDRLISIDSVRAGGLDFAFPQMALTVERIGISDGETRIFRDAGGVVNLSRLIALPPKEAAVETEPDVAEEGALPAFTYRIDLIALENYDVTWEEALDASQANLVVTVPRMEISDVTSDSTVPFLLDAEYLIGEGGRVGIEGRVVADGPELDLNIAASSIPLAPFSPYAERYGEATISKGQLDFSGRVHYADPGKQLVQGNLSISDFAVAYGDGVNAAWNRLSLNELVLELAPFRLALAEVILNEPSVTYVASTSSDTAAPADEEAAAPKAAGDPSQPVRIDSIQIADGRFVFEDPNIEPLAKVVLGAVDFSITNVDLEGTSPANVRLSSELNGSDFLVEGSLSVNQPKEATRLKASLGSLSLPSFSGYSGQAVGRALDEGRLALEADWVIENQQLDASNKIVIQQLSFGENVESDTAVSLPLDLAVMMLSGPDGVMDLSLPLSGDLSDPKVGIWQIVRTALIGLVTNVAAAPFKMLSGLVDAGDEDLSQVGFDPGQSELSPSMQARLDTLSKALKERPELTVVLQPSLSDADLRELSVSKLKLSLMDGKNMADERAFKKRLVKRYRAVMKKRGTKALVEASQKDGHQKMIDALISDYEVNETERAAFAAMRATAVRDYFVEQQGIDSERVVVSAPTQELGEALVRFDLK